MQNYNFFFLQPESTSNTVETNNTEKALCGSCYGAETSSIP